MSLPQCIEGCPQHESMQQRGAYGPLTMLPHKTRARHKKQAQVQNGLLGGGPGRSRGHPKTRKNQKNVPSCVARPTTQLHPGFCACQAITQLHAGLCAGGYSRTNGSRYPPSAHARPSRGWLQPASTSPWLCYQVSSEVFSKSSSVMSS